MASNGAIKGVGAGGGSGIPGGVNTSVQYNTAGAFAGDSDFVWITGSNALGIGLAAPTSNIHVVGDGADVIFRSLWRNCCSYCSNS
jgi:hypothetical protein